MISLKLVHNKDNYDRSKVIIYLNTYFLFFNKICERGEGLV